MRFMALNNSLIPNEKLSSRERIERKIRTFDGRPFTLRDINRLLRPKMKIESVRFHVENLCNNLLVEKLPREGKTPQLYVERDYLKTIKWNSANGSAYEYLMELYRIVNHLKAGNVIPAQELANIREDIRVKAALLREEWLSLLMLHDCPDLWNTKTLVNRLGFNDVEENEK